MCTFRIRRDWIAHGALVACATNSILFTAAELLQQEVPRRRRYDGDRPKRLALSYGLGCMDVDHNHVISIEAARGMQECHGGCVPCVRMRKLRNGQFRHAYEDLSSALRAIESHSIYVKDLTHCR